MPRVIRPPDLSGQWPDTPVGPWVFKDSRFIPRPDYGKMKTLLADAWGNLPPEIHCRVEGTLDGSIEIISNSGGAAAVEEFLAIEADRVSEQDMLGTFIFPIRFAVYDQSDNLRGAYEWYALRELTRTPTEVTVSAMPFPAFNSMGMSIEKQMELTADIVMFFLAAPGAIIEGLLYRMTEVETFTFVNVTRNLPGDIETAAWNAEIDARAAHPASKLEIALTTNSWAREKRVITWRQ